MGISQIMGPLPNKTYTRTSYISLLMTLYHITPHFSLTLRAKSIPESQIKSKIWNTKTHPRAAEVLTT